MKAIIPLLCSLMLIGCGESSSEQTSIPQSNESQPTAVSTTEENNSSLPVQASPETEAAPQSAAVASDAVDGEVLFTQKCTSCHGTKAEKSALGKSQVIAGWKEDQIKEALKGYSAGTYGKEMKAVMQTQAKALNDAQIDALAKHISGL